MSMGLRRSGGSSGGEGGIRTRDTLASMPHFECGAFNHSATSPKPYFTGIFSDIVSLQCFVNDYQVTITSFLPSMSPSPRGCKSARARAAARGDSNRCRGAQAEGSVAWLTTISESGLGLAPLLLRMKP